MTHEKPTLPDRYDMDGWTPNYRSLLILALLKPILAAGNPSH